MINLNPKKSAFSELMEKSRLEMPFSDFEENTMNRIKTEAKYKRIIFSNAKVSMIFFLLGIGAGLVLNIFLSKSRGNFLGIPTEKVLMPFQLLFVIVILTQLENIYRLWVRLSK
jgi:hypothetical protein